MPDSSEITLNLLEMYGRNDWVMRFNFNIFIKKSGLGDLPKDAAILDCGCGMGHLILKLRAFGFTNITGLDAAPEMVEAAVKLTGGNIVIGDVVDVEKLFKSESFDAIILSDILHHIPSTQGWDTILNGCNTSLKNTGLLLVREPYPIFIFNILYKMSGYRIFHIGFLKSRLQSFIEEDELVQYFFANWPGKYPEILRRNGFNIIRDFDWIVHRITTGEKMDLKS